MDANDIQTANTHLASIHERIENVKKRGPASKSHPDGAPSLAERSGDIRDALRFMEAALQRYETKFRVESAKDMERNTAPTGDVVLVFANVQGATGLWDRVSKADPSQRALQ